MDGPQSKERLSNLLKLTELKRLIMSNQAYSNMSHCLSMTESPAWHLISCKIQALRVLPLISYQQLELVTD